MKKNAIFAAVTLCIVVAWGSVSLAGAAIYKNNVLTSSHVSIPGTHISLVPPRGAELATSFAGLEIPESGIRIQVSEANGTSYKEVAGTLTPDGVKALGVSFVDKSPVTINGSSASLVSGTSSSDESLGVFLLVLGNDRLSAYIYGSYPASDKAAETSVKNSVLSCIFTSESVKSLSGGYSLKTNGTSFKFADEVGSTRYFTLDGKPSGGSVDQALYTSSVANDGVAQSDRADYAAAAIDKFLSGQEYTIISSKQVNYGGLSGIETIAGFDGPIKITRTASNATVRRPVKSKGYQVLLFDDEEGRVFIFGGLAVRDADNYISQFSRITSSFSRGQ